LGSEARRKGVRGKSGERAKERGVGGVVVPQDRFLAAGSATGV